MKKIIIAAILISASFVSFAQDRPKDTDEDGGGGFKKENLFTGGGIDLSLSTYGTVLGLEPEFGYSFNKWLDAGVVMNFIYSAQRVYYDDGSLDYKYHQTDFGPGAFVRIYPIDFIFFQAQYENNFIRTKVFDSYGNPTYSSNTSASSLLLGAGYCSGRMGGSGEPFFYLSISADVLANKNSPYVALDAGGNSIVLPIVRGGIQIPLFQNNSGRSTQHKHHRRDDY